MLLLWLKAAVDPCVQVYWDTVSPLSYIFNLWPEGPFWAKPLSGMLLTLVNAVLLNQVLIKNDLIPKNALHGALVYVVLSGMAPQVLSVNPVMVASFFVILALDRLLETFGKADPTKDVFSAAFLVSLASLFYLPAILILLVILLSFAIFGTFSIRMIFVALSGFVAIYLYLSVYYFVADRLEDQYLAYVEYFSHFAVFRGTAGIFQYVLWVVGLLLHIMASLHLFARISEKNISVRRKSTLLFWFSLLALLSVLAEGDHLFHAITLCAIPFSAIIGSYLSAGRKPGLALELFLILFVIAGIINNFIAVC